MKSNKKEKIAIIGIGRVGLPLALLVAEEGFIVYGIEKDSYRVEQLTKGKMPFMEEAGEKLLKKHVNKNFLPTTEYSYISKCNYIILTLGTPVDENMNPIFDQINETISEAKSFLRAEQTLILRSTVSPRTTEYIESIIEKIDHLKIGKNFYLAFCPERISEGKAIDEIKNIPQIIGGVDKKSTKKAVDFFKKIGIETIPTDATSAELAKLFTNMYRYINFAIANEFMVLANAYNKDIYEIVNLVNYKYKRGGLSIPGLTGGPCLFKDGFFLINDLPFIDLISTSWKINESIPLFLIKQIRGRMKLKGKKCVILGLAFKAEIDDIRESLSFKVRKALLREGADIILHDPYVKKYANQVIEDDVYNAVRGADLIFIATNHKEYKQLEVKKIKNLVKKNCMICDVWNVLKTNKIIFRLNYINNETK